MTKHSPCQHGKGGGSPVTPGKIFGEQGCFAAAANRQVVPFDFISGPTGNDQLLVMKVIFCKTWKLSPDALPTNTLGK